MSRRISFLLLALLTVVFVLTAQVQIQPVTIGDFPWLLMLPLVLGMAAHYLKGYKDGSITVSFLQYWKTAIGRSVMTIVGAVVQLLTLFATDPAKFLPATSIVVLITVFQMGYMWDSAANGSASTAKNGS